MVFCSTLVSLSNWFLNTSLSLFKSYNFFFFLFIDLSVGVVVIRSHCFLGYRLNDHNTLRKREEKKCFQNKVPSMDK